MPFEAVPFSPALQFERRALDELPAERLSDDGPEILTGDHRRHQSFEAQAHDTAGTIPRRHPHVTQPRSAVAAGAQRPQQIGGGQLRRPRRRPAASVVGL